MAVKRDFHSRSMAVLATAFVVGVFAYPRLRSPFLDQALPSRVMVAFGLPITAAVIYALFRSLWKHDRVRTGNGAFEATYSSIVFRCLLFVAGLHFVVTAVLIGAAVDRVVAMRAVVIMLGLTFVAVGNLLPRTRPNVAVGVRTKLTLANGQLWSQIHRMGGYVTVGLGIVIAISAIALSGQVLGAAIGSASLAAVGTVLVSYRRCART